MGSIRRINAWNAQNADAHARRATKVPNPAFSINSPSSSLCRWICSSCFRSNAALAIAIDAAGRAVHQRHRHRAAPQCRHQRRRAWVAPCVTLIIRRRRCQVNDTVGNARQATQGIRRVQIGNQRCHAASAQRAHPLGRRRGGNELQTPAQFTRHTQADITAADDQKPTAAKSGWQSAQGRLV